MTLIVANNTGIYADNRGIYQCAGEAFPTTMTKLVQPYQYRTVIGVSGFFPQKENNMLALVSKFFANYAFFEWFTKNESIKISEEMFNLNYDLQPYFDSVINGAIKIMNNNHLLGITKDFTFHISGSNSKIDIKKRDEFLAVGSGDKIAATLNAGGITDVKELYELVSSVDTMVGSVPVDSVNRDTLVLGIPFNYYSKESFCILTSDSGVDFENRTLVAVLVACYISEKLMENLEKMTSLKPNLKKEPKLPLSTFKKVIKDASELHRKVSKISQKYLKEMFYG